MRSSYQALVAAVGMLACGAAAAQTPAAKTPAAKPAPEMSLTRLDCGTPQAPFDVNDRFSDVHAYKDLKLQFVYSCYLVKHGDDYMLWDSGQSMEAGAVAPKVSLVDQLAQLKVTPAQIKFLGISHYHGDHIGQANSFAKSTLLIGKGDWDGLTSAKPPAGVNPKLVSSFVAGGAVEPVTGDKDVFGDGTVVMLYTPGHTPGHHSLLVKLAKTGNVVLSGDMAHFHENFESNGVPGFNYDRAQTVASIDRIKKIARNFKAKLIIQHDKRDIAALPAFPAAAR